MAIRRNFNEEVTEEATTPVSNDPNKLTYDKTDAYSQDVPAGDEGIAGTVDVDLDSKDEVLKDDGVPTLNAESTVDDELNEVLEQMTKLTEKVKQLKKSSTNDRKMNRAAKLKKKNKAAIDEDAFFESIMARVLKEDNAIDDKKEDEKECDKTADVAGEGDGVNVTDTISGVIDDEKEDNEISDREIKPDVDGVAMDKTVVVNNESYKIRITATKLD